ncbi:hypothetical protein AAFF_G00249870 [Aldrovandia affinis]|uniref:Uncharacterized protein n=1 Tax=Aldrovandia affinis TaxID=143900 RepID=A0AAD7RFN9_9TELE|nr:hypothetical protein AAFF_G00249870 [Aldrovandia affinis]
MRIVLDTDMLPSFSPPQLTPSLSRFSAHCPGMAFLIKVTDLVPSCDLPKITVFPTSEQSSKPTE